MTRKLRKGDFMEGDLEIRTGWGEGGGLKKKFFGHIRSIFVYK